MKKRTATILAAALASAAFSFGEETLPPAAPPGTAAPDLYQVGRELFDAYAPDDVKAQYDFPTREQFEQFMARLQKALDEDDMSGLAAYEPQARATLAVLRSIPGYEDYAAWLAARLEEIDQARAIVQAGARPTPQARPGVPAPAVPYYDAWLQRLRSRPAPANAAALMPRLRTAFAAEGAPPELAWVAEVESSLNPSARSPAGAKGLFQLKADTARGLGLSTFLPDDRTDPEKSAHAAARLLKRLDEKFGSWPLALAAYNAGEGRVGRALRSRHAAGYAGIASSLPAETRMYVPEVLALVATRTGKKL